MRYRRSFDGARLIGKSPETTPLLINKSVARVSVEWAMPPAARAMLVKVRSPVPIAARTARAWAWSGNSADSDSWAETTSGLTGLASSLARKDLVSAPFFHLAHLIGRPPVIRVASNASAAERPAMAERSAGFTGPTVIWAPRWWKGRP